MDELSMRPVPVRLNGMEHCGRSNSGNASHTTCCTLYVRCAAFCDTLSREFLMLIPIGRSEDIWLALRRREQREMKNKCESSGGSVGARQSLTARQPVNPVEEGATNRLRSSTDCDRDVQGGNAAMYYERCEVCGNRWQRIAVAGPTERIIFFLDASWTFVLPLLPPIHAPSFPGLVLCSTDFSLPKPLLCF